MRHSVTATTKPPSGAPAVGYARDLNHRYGVTSVQDASLTAQLLRVLASLDAADDLDLHVAAHLVWLGTAERDSAVVTRRRGHEGEPMTVNQEIIDAAAHRLEQAAATGEPCDPVRDLIGRDDLVSAYAVQDVLTARRIEDGGEVAGRKIGLTSVAVQQQLGVDRPDFGVLFASMAHADGATIAMTDVMQPRVEAEIAFVLDRDLADGLLDAKQIRAATEYVVAALEVCGSRIRDWDISFGDTVADNASGGAFVLGSRRHGLDEVVPADVEMMMSIDGEQVSEGNGAACLGDPVEAVVWLARTARDLGEPLRAGQVILSGALGPMRPVMSRQRVSATLSGLGSVTVDFA